MQHDDRLAGCGRLLPYNRLCATVQVPMSDAERPGIGGLARVLLSGQWRDGAGLVEPDVGVELAGEFDAGIVALQLGVGPIDHADEALEPLLAELGAQRFARLAHHQHATADAAVVELPLDAAGPRRPYVHDLHRPVPVMRRRHGAAVGAEADGCHRVAEALTTELAEIELVANPAHVGEAGVADMRVVRPYDRFRAGPAMVEQTLEGV